MEKPLLIVIVGPTGVGKTKTAIDLAKEFDAEIISSDSRQFYKELSIGTAKPDKEELKQAKHHFVNTLSIQEDYNASDFEKDVLHFLKDYFSRKKIAILCGGSGMYINAVTDGFDNRLPGSDPVLRKHLLTGFEKSGIVFLQQELLRRDPEFYERIDRQNSKRLLRAIEICHLTGKSNLEIRKGEQNERFFDTLKIGLELNRKELYHRINQRVDKMMEAGLLDEVKSVIEFKEKNALKTVGYRELFNYLDGEVSLNDAVEKIKVNSRRYAKRQLTWFKKDSTVEWFSPYQFDKISMYLRNSFTNQ